MVIVEKKLRYNNVLFDNVLSSYLQVASVGKAVKVKFFVLIMNLLISFCHDFVFMFIDSCVFQDAVAGK